MKDDEPRQGLMRRFVGEVVPLLSEADVEVKLIYDSFLGGNLDVTWEAWQRLAPVAQATYEKMPPLIAELTAAGMDGAKTQAMSALAEAAQAWSRSHAEIQGAVARIGYTQELADLLADRLLTVYTDWRRAEDALHGAGGYGA